MMNLSCTGNMSREIQCFTCGMPSSTDWARKVRSRPSTPLKPYYPFLLTLSQPSSAFIKEDGSTFVCAFCHASLEAQWSNYERQTNAVHPNSRKYNLYKFICACCGVETYRKRVRTLPFQEFPFLANSQRPPGSLTLGNNPLAVVCLDCSETLWAQSAEYDRWGLPVSKRHFNWMARPPPPEDSVEATVARLPSGAVRCPPTEPIIVVKPPKEIPNYEPPALSNNKTKPRNSKSESTDLGMDNVPGQTSRKTSLTHGGVHPPIVVVQPLQESGYPKYEPLSSVGLHSLPFQRSPMFPGYSSSLWGGAAREGTALNEHAYPSVDGVPSSSSSTAASWPWSWPSNLYIPSTFSNRSYNLSEPFYNSYYPPSSPETNSTSTVPASSSSPYLIPYSLSNSGRSSPIYSSSSIPSSITTHSRNVPVNEHSEQSSHVQHRKLSSDSLSLKVPMTSSSPTAQDIPCRKSSCGKCCSSNNNNNNNDNRSKSTCLPVSSNSSRGTISTSKKSTSSLPTKHGIHQMNNNINTNLREPNFKSTTNFCGNALPSNFKPKANAIRNHNNEKLLLDSSQGKSSSINNNNNNVNTTAKVSSSNDGNENNIKPTSISVSNNQIIHPKKWQWQSQNGKMKSSKSRTCNVSECEPMDFSNMSSNNSFKLNPTSNYNSEVNSPLPKKHNTANMLSNVVVDLTSTKQSTPSKFMIAYLCQSESTESTKEETKENPELSSTNKLQSNQDNLELNIAPRSGRSSVIVTLPKTDTLNKNDEHKCKMIEHEDKEEASKISHENCRSSSDNDSNENTLKLENVSSTFEDLSYSSSPKNQNTSAINNSDHENTNLIIDEMETETVLINKKEKQAIPQLDNNENQHEENLDEMIKNKKDDNRTSDKCERSPSVQKIINEIIEEYKLEDRNTKLRKRKLEEDQEQFLGSLGLITPKKKLDLELESLISRCERSTLPLTKFRPTTPSTPQISEEFESKLLQIAFDDPSLCKKSDLNQNEVAFLAELDLKPASRHEKTLREKTWRYILTERMLREKRGKNLRGIKKLWESYNRVFTRFPIIIKSPRNQSSDILGSLSLTLPESGANVAAHLSEGSDLLSIVDNSSEQSTTILPKESITVSAMCIVQKQSFPQIPQISIPKYIPRCQVSVPLSFDSAANLSSESSNVAHHHENSGPSSSRCQSPNKSEVNKNPCSLHKIQTNENINDHETNNKITTGVIQNPVVTSNSCSINTKILWVPIINNTKSVPNTFTSEINQENNSVPEKRTSYTSATIHIKEDELQDDSTQEEEIKNLSNSIGAIIEADKLHCTNLELQIHNLLNSISTKPNLKIEDWKNLRKYIQSRQQKAKLLEDQIKKKEKQILKKLRATNTKNTQK